MDERRLGVAYAMSAYLLWGMLTLYWHELSGLNAFELIGQRILWSVIVLALVTHVRRAWPDLRTLRSDRAVLVRTAVAAILITINWTTYVWAVTHGNAIETALGYFIAPLIVSTLGVIVLHETLKAPQLVAMAFAAVAIAILTVGHGRPPLMALTIAASWAVYGLLKRTIPLTALSSLTGETMLIAPLALVMVIAHEAPGPGIWAQATPVQQFLVPLSGLATAIPLLLFAAAARRVPLTTLGPLQFCIPAINFLLGLVVFHEEVPLWRYIGFAFILIALAISTTDTLRRLRLPARSGSASLP